MKNKSQSGGPEETEQISTGNLYKFCSLISLVFLLASLAAPTFYLTDTNNEMIRLNLQACRQNYMYERTKYYNDSCKVYMDSVKLGLFPSLGHFKSGDGVISEIMDNADTNSHHYLRTKNMYDSTLLVMDELKLHIKYAGKSYNVLGYKENKVIVISTTTFILSSLLSVVFFILWYIKHQLYLDIQIQKEVGLTFKKISEVISRRTKNAIIVVVVLLISSIIIYLLPLSNFYYFTYPKFAIPS